MDPQLCTQQGAKVQRCGCWPRGTRRAAAVISKCPSTLHLPLVPASPPEQEAPSRGTCPAQGPEGEPQKPYRHPEVLLLPRSPLPDEKEKVDLAGCGGPCPGGAAAAGTDRCGCGGPVSLPRETRWTKQMMRWTSPAWPSRARARCWNGSAVRWRGAAPVAVKSPRLLRQTTCLWLK